jgi:transmembrane sensor
MRFPDSADAPWALLARHLAAETSAGEAAVLRQWLHADPRHLQILTTVTRAWERAGEAAPSPLVFSAADVEDAWQRFKPQMGEVKPAQAVTPEPAPQPVTAAAVTPEAVLRPLVPASPSWQPTFMRIAAALVLLAGAAYALSIVRFGKGAEGTQGSYASRERRHFVRLPDGSTAWLNANSRLQYAQGADGPRAVQLTGEAYFEVKPDKAHPFLVRTTTARVRVTGTAFNVRAYAAEDSVEVSVSHGKVWLARLAGPADSVLLAAGTRAALHAADAPGLVAAPLRSALAADANFRAWQTDTLRFQDTPLPQVARTLRARFGTRVQLAGAGLSACRFTGTFAHPQPAQVLAVLALATGSHAAPDSSGGYVLRGTGCAIGGIKN